MRIDRIVIREIRLRLKAPFETSFGLISDRKIILVEVFSDGVVGWGEVTAAEGPFYNSESKDTSWIILRDFIVPLVVGKTVHSPEEIPALVRAVRGHEMSKAAVENAVWDVSAQQGEISLATRLGGARTEIACGVSLGIRAAPDELIAAIESELAAGYQRIKIKIKPGKDLEFISAARRKFPMTRLMVDANSAYGLEDSEHLKKFDDFNLMMIEQPLAWDDIYEHSKLQGMLETPICLDESIHNLQQTKAALALKACRVVNIKLGRVGGHTQAKSIAEYCQSKEIPVWCGGMLESGIGRAHNIALATLPGFTL